MSGGQINRGTKIGDALYELAKLPEIKTIVEIGTWNGLGSTKCIRDAIVDKFDCQFYSIEAYEYQYKIAIENNVPIPDNCKLLLGRIVEVKDLDKEKLIDDEAKWLKDDIINYEAVSNVLYLLPEKIDLLLLDGGEFSSRAEWNKLKNRCNYVMLDDTKVRKNRIVRKEINNSLKEYEVLQDVKTDRNGWFVARRKK